MKLFFENTTRRDVNIGLLKRYIERAARAFAVRLRSYCPKGAAADLALNVYFVGDSEIRRINREHRGKDTATDVISFSYVEQKNFVPFIKGEPYIAGEIFLSLPTIMRQAKEKGVDYDIELVYMLIHGFLHVFGYDHNTDKEELEMERAALRILGKKHPRRAEFGF